VRKNLSRRRLGRAAVALALCAYLVVTLFPFYWTVQVALKTTVDAFKVPTDWIFVPTLGNFAELPGSTNFMRFFANSLVVSVITVAVSLLLAVPAAYGFSRGSFARKEAFFNVVLITRMMPGMAFIIPFFLPYRQIGLMDSILGLVVIYMTMNLSLVLWSMRNFFDAVPRELEEAAFIDGASVLQAFRQVVLPVSAPGLAATAVLCFIMSWNEFFFALILTRREAVTAPVGIMSFMRYEATDFGLIATTAIIIALPVVLFSYVVRRYLVAGIMTGAVK